MVAAAVGGSGTADDRAALITRGTAVQLADLPGYAAAGAFDVNDFGVATGYALISGRDGFDGSLPITSNARPQVAVVWRNGTPVALSEGAGTIGKSVGYAINDAGQVAGLARLNDGLIRAVRWSSDGKLTILSIGSGQTMSVARAINGRGDIAGQTSRAGVNGEGAVWLSSKRFDLTLEPNLGDVATRGINDQDTVVGFAQRFVGPPENAVAVATGALWVKTGNGFSAFTLNSLVMNLGGWQTSAPQAIDNRGDIVGFGVAPDGSGRAYLLTPLPEPTSWALMIVGFGAIGAQRRYALAKRGVGVRA